LELGVVPVRLEIIKRKIICVQHILQQDKESMIHQVFEATAKMPIKNDYVQICEKYLQVLLINLNYKEI
jgi:hypothetical protein